MRKFFSKKPKEHDSKRFSPPRHNQYQSVGPRNATFQDETEAIAATLDPKQLMQSPPTPENIFDTLPNQQSPTPAPMAEPLVERRVRSANAFEFPYSTRLKPLDLGNPFCRPANGPRRRATLPSLMLDDGEAAALAAKIAQQTPEKRVAFLGAPWDTPESQIGVAVTSTPSDNKTRSRSVDNLRQSSMELHLPRLRTPSAIGRCQKVVCPRSPVASTIKGAGTPDVGRMFDQEAHVTSQAEQNAVSISPADSAKSSPSMAFPDQQHRAGGELEKDLEERVTRLEYGLLNFQRALKRVTPEPSDKTLMTDFPFPRRSRQHTPSMLVTTLRDRNYHPPPLDPVSSPPSPPLTATPDELYSEAHPDVDNHSTPLPTFAALYDMFTDERTARQSLEIQIHSLRQDLAEMRHHQLLPRSKVACPVPAFHLPLSKQRYVSLRTHDMSNSDHLDEPPVASKLSKSDSLTKSEVAAMWSDGIETKGSFAAMSAYTSDTIAPCELYQTPLQWQGEWQGRRGVWLATGDGDGMF